MAKKQIKIKKAAKSARPAGGKATGKAKASTSKSKPAKVAKNSSKKAASNKTKVDKTKKTVAKPAAKTVKPKAKKVDSKPAKKQAPAKKPARPASGKTGAKAIVKTTKEKNDNITTKPSKATKSTKETKGAKLSKEELKPARPGSGKIAKTTGISGKKEKEKPSKKKKGDDDEEDVEIVDLWNAPEEEEEIEELEPKPVKQSKGGRKPKGSADDDEPAIGTDDILIEELINSTKKLKKPTAKVPVQIRTFTNPMASLVVPKSAENKKAPKKEPKGKFELEYVIRTSAPILYEFLTSPSELAEWFADNVNLHEGVFTFTWDGTEQKARLLGFKADTYVRMQWLDKPEGTYFEFRIERDELTGDVSLIVIDFADEGSDMETSKRLWDAQVNQLSHVIGSY